MPPAAIGEDALEAFDAGRAVELIARRNRQLGNLLLAERGAFYIQILYRLLLFRRDHELEPLYETIYTAVRPAQNRLIETGEYDLEHFRADLDQLLSWELITCRIEIERLRGYRDTRKQKFRYSLTEETVAFLQWLEELRLAELERPEHDARDLLEETSSSLRELLRVLDRFETGKRRESDPRRVLYQLCKLDELCLAINSRLSAFNACLLNFVVNQYMLGEAKRVLRELEDFVDRFVRQIHELRGGLVEQVEKLLLLRNRERIRAVARIIAGERRQAPHLLRQPNELPNLDRIPFRLREFFRENGKLDTLCLRIHGSALKVWRKLHAHLRELERRNNRIEDLRERIDELAAMPENAVPHRFFLELLGPAVMRADPNYWDEYERADPPQPRRRYPAARPSAPQYFAPKKRGRGPVVSMEQARLEKLRKWLETTLGQTGSDAGRPLSTGAFTDPGDFQRLMDVSKAALLDQGRRLARVRYQAVPAAPPENSGAALATVRLDRQALSFREMMIRRLPAAGDSGRH